MIDLQEPVSSDAVFANTRALLPVIAEASDRIELDAKLPPDIAALLRKAGVFQMSFPASRSGLEMSLADQTEIVRLIARVDASAGWNVGVLNAGGAYAGRLAEGAYAELYPTRDRPTSGSFHPRGRAERVEGGYLVSGNWSWGSGSYVADHVVGGCFVYDDGKQVLTAEGKPMVIGVWLPRESITVLDDWSVLGMRGSGSTSYSITQPVFVRESYTFDREAPADPRADPINKTPNVALHALTGVYLGLSQHLVDLLVGEARRRFAADPASVDARMRVEIGRAVQIVDFAIAGTRDAFARVDEVIFGTSDDLSALRYTRGGTGAADALRQVLPIVTELVSARYVFDGQLMQRLVRDAHVALAHTGAKLANYAGLATAVLESPAKGPFLSDGIMDAAVA